MYRAKTKTSSCSDEIELEELRAEQSLSTVRFGNLNKCYCEDSFSVCFMQCDGCDDGCWMVSSVRLKLGKIFLKK